MICANALIIVIALLIGALSGKPRVAFKEGELVTYVSSLQLGMCSVVSGLNFFPVFLSEKNGRGSVFFGLCLLEDLLLVLWMNC